MTMPVEAIRIMFLGQGTVVGAYVLLSLSITVLLLLSGILVFSKVEKTFIDTV